jgi:hypothetical protein
VDLDAGAFAWKHNNLYRNHHFNSFAAPKIQGPGVMFKEAVIYNEPAKTISVEKRSGKIVSVN